MAHDEDGYDLHIHTAVERAPGGWTGSASVRNAHGSEVKFYRSTVQSGSHHQAAYRAIHGGLLEAQQHGYRNVAVHTPNKLVADQLSARVKVNDPSLVRLHADCQAKAHVSFDRVAFHHAPDLDPAIQAIADAQDAACLES